MSGSPRIRKLPPRPKITIPIPGQYYPQAATGMGYVPTPYGQTPIPMTPVSGHPQMMNANRASQFVFKGIKDFTKSGLSVGEKSVYWLYEKVTNIKFILFFIRILFYYDIKILFKKKKINWIMGMYNLFNFEYWNFVDTIKSDMLVVNLIYVCAQCFSSP